MQKWWGDLKVYWTPSHIIHKIFIILVIDKLQNKIPLNTGGGGEFFSPFKYSYIKYISIDR